MCLVLLSALLTSLLQDRRLARPPVSTGPGAAAYGLPSLLQTRQDFNKSSTTGPFHLPIAKKLERHGFPAPNEYDVLQFPLVRAVENIYLHSGLCSYFELVNF